LTSNDVSESARQKLTESLVLVHGGMAQNVGPILEMVTEKYLLRSEAEWKARQETLGILDEILDALRKEDVAAVGAATWRNFTGPLQTIIPWASNFYTETLIDKSLRGIFQGFSWILDARRDVRRRHGFYLFAVPQSGGPGTIADNHERNEA